MQTRGQITVITISCTVAIPRACPGCDQGANLERSGRGDRGDENARHRRAHDRADGVLHRRAAVALVDVAAVQHGDEVDAESGQQRGESGAGLRELCRT